MKTFAGIIFFVVALISMYYVGALWAESKRPVTNETFQSRMDSLARVTDVLERNQDSIKKNIDTLKLGQKVIFDQVKKKQDISFWDLFR